jgi:hypothetical protein
VLREHGERWDDVRSHMDHVSNSLAALTGGTSAFDAPFLDRDLP